MSVKVLPKMRYLVGPMGCKQARKELRLGPADIDELYKPAIDSINEKDDNNDDEQVDTRLRSISSAGEPSSSAVESIAGTSATSAATSHPTFSIDPSQVSGSIDIDNNTTTVNNTAGPKSPTSSSSALLLSQLYDSAAAGDFPTFQRLEAELEHKGISIPFQQLTSTAIQHIPTDSAVLRHCIQQGASLHDSNPTQPLQHLNARPTQSPPPRRPIRDPLDAYQWNGSSHSGDEVEDAVTDVNADDKRTVTTIGEAEEVDSTRLRRAFREDPRDLMYLMDRGAALSPTFLQAEARNSTAGGFRPACIAAVIARRGIAVFENTGIGHRAAALGAIEVVHILLESGADVNEVFALNTPSDGLTQQDEGGVGGGGGGGRGTSSASAAASASSSGTQTTMLLEAVKTPRFDIVSLLLDYGARPQTRQQFEEIFRAAVRSNDERILGLLRARVRGVLLPPAPPPSMWPMNMKMGHLD